MITETDSLLNQLSVVPYDVIRELSLICFKKMKQTGNSGNFSMIYSMKNLLSEDSRFYYKRHLYFNI